MPRLIYRDLHSLTKVLRDLYDCPDLGTFPARILSLLRQLVPAEIVAYNEVNPSAGQFRPVVDPPGVWPSDGDQVFVRHMSEHPLIAYYQRTGNGRTVKISDFLSRRQLLRLGLYNELYKPLGVETQIAFAVSVASPQDIIGIALTRGLCDFSERDRLLLDLLRPHAIQAYHNAEAMTRVQHELARLKHVLEESAQGAIVLDQSGAARLMTEQAWWWLREYFAQGSRQGDRRLPEALREWLVAQQSQLVSDGDVPPVRTPLVIERDGKRLVARLLPGRVEDEWLILLEEQRTAFSAQSLESLGLTRREAEVLFWVAQGKTNPEVAIILGITPRTVHKHLERIYPEARRRDPHRRYFAGAGGTGAAAALKRAVCPRVRPGSATILVAFHSGRDARAPGRGMQLHWRVHRKIHAELDFGCHGQLACPCPPPCTGGRSRQWHPLPGCTVLA